MKIPHLLIFIMSLCLFVALESSADSYIPKARYSNYLAKMINSQLNKDAFIYDFKQIKYDAEINAWLESLDSALDTRRLPRLDADFELILSKDASIEALKLLEIREDNFEKFREFSANIMDLKLPALPESMPAYTKFRLHTKWMYIDRNTSGLSLAEDEIFDFDRAQLAKSYSIKDLKEGESIEAVLIEPGFIDYPRIGEQLKFELPELKAKAQARVIDVNNKEAKLLVNKFSLDNGALINKEQLYVLKQQNEDAAANYAEAMVNNAAYMMNIVGIGPAISTNGIAVGAAIALGMGTGALKEYKQAYSFNISKGDSFILEGGSKK